MKKRNLISFGAALILLFGDCFCVSGNQTSDSNPLKRGFNNDINQRRSKANRDSHSKEGVACSYLNEILPKKKSINRNNLSEMRNNMIVAYYKSLGGTYNKNQENKFKQKTYSKAASYLGFDKKTAQRALSKLKDKEGEFNKIEPKNIKDLAAKIVNNYKSHTDKDSLIGAIIALKDLGFSCIRIIELLGLDFNSNRENQNMVSVDEASSSNPRYSVDNRNSRMSMEYLLSESVPENQNIVPVDDSNREHPSASEQSLVNNNSTERISNDGSADNKTSYLGKRRKISDSADQGESERNQDISEDQTSTFQGDETERTPNFNQHTDSVDEANSLNQIYSNDENISNSLKRDFNNDINQRRSKAIRDSHSKEGVACSYLNEILPKKKSINRNKLSEMRNNMIVAYYKSLGGTYNKNQKNKFKQKTYSKAVSYLGFNEKTARTALSKLKDKEGEFNKIEPKNIKDLAAKIVKNYKSHPDKDSSNSPLIGAIIALKDLGFSCIRIIELLGLDFNSNRENQNMGSVNEASSSNPRYSVDNRNPRMRIEYLLSESVPENQNIVPVDDSNREHPSASEQSLVNNNSTERISNDGSADNKTSYLGKRRKISDSEGRKKSKGKQPANESDDLIEILSDTESDESDGLIEILSDTESENESFENKRKRARF